MNDVIIYLSENEKKAYNEKAESARKAVDEL
jgi:hypothetical protein